MCKDENCHDYAEFTSLNVQCARASQLNLQIFAVASALFHKYVQNGERSPSRELNDVINNHEIKQCRD